MAAGKYKITVDQGATFRLEFTVFDGAGDPWDLTSYSARMQVRPSIESSDVVLDADTDNYISLGGNDGTVVVLVPADDTADLPDGHFIYDFELESNGGEVTRVLQGAFIVSPEVTR